MYGHRTYLDLMKRPYTRGRTLQAPRKPGHRQFSYPMRHLAHESELVDEGQENA